MWTNRNKPCGKVCDMHSVIEWDTVILVTWTASVCGEASGLNSSSLLTQDRRSGAGQSGYTCSFFLRGVLSPLSASILNKFSVVSPRCRNSKFVPAPLYVWSCIAVPGEGRRTAPGGREGTRPWCGGEVGFVQREHGVAGRSGHKRSVHPTSGGRDTHTRPGCVGVQWELRWGAPREGGAPSLTASRGKDVSKLIACSHLGGSCRAHLKIRTHPSSLTRTRLLVSFPVGCCQGSHHFSSRVPPPRNVRDGSVAAPTGAAAWKRHSLVLLAGLN